MLTNLYIVTLFPEIFESFLNTSLVKKAISEKLVNINLINLRDYGLGKQSQVDDVIYGGGAGMLIRPEPLAAAIEEVKEKIPNLKIIYLTPKGKTFNQTVAKEFSKTENILFICGRYEGIDQRIIDLYVDREISLGNFVTMGGEVPAMSVIEASIRLIPGVLGNPKSLEHESFADEKNVSLEAPHYTRPEEFMGKKVPEVLLSGDHKKIKEWRDKNSGEKK